MKRAGNLYQKISELSNLQLAFWRAQRGKSGREDVIRFRDNLDEELQGLALEIQNGTVAIGDYHYFTITLCSP